MWRILTNKRHCFMRRWYYAVVVILVVATIRSQFPIYVTTTKNDSPSSPSPSSSSSSTPEIGTVARHTGPRVFQKLTNIAAYRYERYNHRNDPDERPGAWGRGLHLGLTGTEKEREVNLTKKEAFNILVSEKIPLNRSLPDLRMDGCKNIKYDITQLPTASVVLIFNNEAWTTLMRTAHSVINRSPPELLKDVVLVDDFSDRPELTGDKLDEYAKKEWPDGVVKVVHLKERSGLVVARQRGAEASTADVVVFLDAHCEASEGWLEPILQRIAEKRSAVVCPIIGTVNAQDFEAYGGGDWIGGFTWSLHYRWRSMPQREMKRRKGPTDTIMSPTMAGGLLAVDRQYFFEIGGYDTGMDIWGGENLEISFRTWMCGGSVEFIPCSQVPHLWRDFHPYTFRNGKDTHGLNSIRLAEAMMDDYKRFFYLRRRSLKPEMGGDVSDRLAIRKRLQCKSFKWYLDNVYPEKFINDEQSTHWGYVKNLVGNRSLCLDTMSGANKKMSNLGLYLCPPGVISVNQMLSFSFWSELRFEEYCAYLTADVNDLYDVPKPVPMRSCTRETNVSSDTTELWHINDSTGQIIHQESGRCLTTLGLSSGSDVLGVRCDVSDPHQKWVWEHVKGEPSPYVVTLKPKF